MQSESAARPKFARRHYLIDRGFQLKYTLILVLVGAAIALLFGLMMYQAHTVATELMELPAQFQAEVASRDGTLLWMVVGIAGVMAIALGLFGIVVTHRVAGPIFVFSRYLRVLAQGRYPELRPLRRGDELKEFYEAFYQTVASLRERDRTNGEALEELARAAEQVALQSPAAADALRPVVEQARAMSRRLLDAAASEGAAVKTEAARAA